MKTKGTARISLDRLRQLERYEDNLSEISNEGFWVCADLGDYKIGEYVFSKEALSKIEEISERREKAYSQINERLEKEIIELKEQLESKKSWWRW